MKIKKELMNDKLKGSINNINKNPIIYKMEPIKPIRTNHTNISINRILI